MKKGDFKAIDVGQYRYGGVLLSNSNLQHGELVAPSRNIIETSNVRYGEQMIRHQNSHIYHSQRVFDCRAKQESHIEQRDPEDIQETSGDMQRTEETKDRAVQSLEVSISNAYLTLKELDESIEMITGTCKNGNNLLQIMIFLQRCAEDLSTQAPLLLKDTDPNKVISTELDPILICHEIINSPCQPAVSTSSSNSHPCSTENNDEISPFLSWLNSLGCHTFDTNLTLQCPILP